MKLLEMKAKEKGIILQVNSQSEAFIQRILALGIDFDTPVEVKYKAPFGGPVCLKIRNKLIMMRQKEAQDIWITPVV
ncbi:MAG: FeoA family protein [Chitinophagales bacterium]